MQGKHAVRTVQGRSLPETSVELLAPEMKPVLLVIDVQNDFADPGGHFAKAGADVSDIQATIPAIGALLREARAAGLPLVHIHQNTLPQGRSDSDAWLRFKTRSGRSPDYTLPGSWGAEAVRPCAPEAGEPVVVKFRPDGFLGTNLDRVLKAAGHRTVVVCGLFTEGCVESTVRSASYRDYFVIVAADAVASAMPALHAASLAFMRSRYPVLPADEILSAFREGRKAR